MPTSAAPDATNANDAHCSAARKPLRRKLLRDFLADFEARVSCRLARRGRGVDPRFPTAASRSRIVRHPLAACAAASGAVRAPQAHGAHGFRCAAACRRGRLPPCQDATLTR